MQRYHKSVANSARGFYMTQPYTFISRTSAFSIYELERRAVSSLIPFHSVDYIFYQSLLYVCEPRGIHRSCVRSWTSLIRGLDSTAVGRVLDNTFNLLKGIATKTTSQDNKNNVPGSIEEIANSASGGFLPEGCAQRRLWGVVYNLPREHRDDAIPLHCVCNFSEYVYL